MAKPLEAVEPKPSLTQKLGDILVDMKLLSTEELNAALDRSLQKKMRIGELLMSENKITDIDLAKALAIRHGLEFFDLASFIPNKNSAKIIPEKIARTFCLLPIDSKEGIITLTTYDPIQLVKLDNLEKRFGGSVVLKISTKQQIESALNKIYVSDYSVEKIVSHLAKIQDKKTTAKNAAATPNLASALVNHKLNGKTSDPSVESLVNQFIEKALIERSSDIHLDPAESFVRVRVRIDGELRELYTYPLDLHSSVMSRIKVLSQLDIAERRLPQDGGFHYSQGKFTVDIRVSTLPTVHGEKMVLRLLDKSKMRGTLSQIGMSSELETEVLTLLQRPHGMIFVTGPTGSGKTTTLYSMLHQVNGVKKNVITVEDPVEFKFDAINQVQVNEKAGLNFVGLLRNILRQDPDVLMIGEVRDQETADIAIRAALTGHLVLSTLHTNDAVSATTRLVDMGIQPFLISSSLVGVLAQRLIRALCSHCKKKTELAEEDAKLLGTTTLTAGSIVYEPMGCDSCADTGYQNRVAIFEFMLVDHHLQRAIIESKSEAEMLDYLNHNGFISMRQDGIQKIRDGITSIEEVLKATI